MELQAPIKSVQIAAESSSQEASTPEVGDEVAVTYQGRVTRIEGDNIYFEPDTANGESLPKDQSQKDEQSDEDKLREIMLGEQNEKEAKDGSDY